MTRVLLAKPGLDGHDKGIKVLATILRDAGCEVIYTGLHQTPQKIALAAVQEDVDVIGLSMLSGAHVDLSRDVIEQLREAGLGERPVIVGGNIPLRDVALLTGLGAAAVFPTGTSYEEIIGWFAALPTATS
ncbi:cobalamin B12-binding domain-containing protein [Aeromicrobium sp.]|uniref:cobalamin B12-binding domain-containing protein n=1 Tax=Aeromicrobium sp. TaxID=1871063 RepID=UPI0025C64ACA|nr:cobalamin B12-binding domain-containing protein [Aeromicrobium sp.]MCK5892600.1 cobalamin B12-binding domain-containing protein [Aeromicrobium sp.]